MNHLPTDDAIKSSVMLALGSSAFGPCSILAQRYRQNDHANKTWTDLRMDIESNITNNVTDTSRDPDIHMRQRDRAFRVWRRSPSRFDQPPTTAANAPANPTTPHPTSPPTSALQLLPVKPTPPLNYTPAPNVVAITVPRNATAPNVSPAKPNSPPPHFAKPTT